MWTNFQRKTYKQIIILIYTLEHIVLIQQNNGRQL